MSDPKAPPPEKPRPPLRRRLAEEGSYPAEYMHRPGQRPPRRFSALSWSLALYPDFLKQFEGEVPAEYWSVAALDTRTGRTALATVACPCGEEPMVPQLGTAECPGEGCGRFFLLSGERIRVARFEPTPSGDD